MKKLMVLITLLMMVTVYRMPEKAIVEKWETYTGVRDSVSVWFYSYQFVVRPTGGLVLKNGLVEIRPLKNQ